jgi:hypothetical protein
MTRASLVANSEILNRAYRVAVVTGGSPNNPEHGYRHSNVAEVVFISTVAGLNQAISAEAPDFGVITHVIPNTPSGQSLGTVLVAGEAPRLVASTEALQVGQFVRLTNTNAAFTAPGETAARPLVAIVDDEAVPFVAPGEGINRNTSNQAVLAMNAVGTVTQLDAAEVATVAGTTINRAAGRVLNYTNHGGNVLIDMATSTDTRVVGNSASFTVPAANLVVLNVDRRTNQAWSANDGMRVPNMGTGGAPGTNYVNTLNGPRQTNAYGYYRGAANAIVWYDASSGQALAVILVRTRIQGNP